MNLVHSCYTDYMEDIDFGNMRGFRWRHIRQEVDVSVTCLSNAIILGMDVENIPIVFSSISSVA